MKIELNRKVLEQLQGIYFVMDHEHKLLNTAYFPFIVCFEWVHFNGEPVRQKVQRRRIKVCEAYNLYLTDGEAGSFENLKIALNNLIESAKGLELDRVDDFKPKESKLTQSLKEMI